MQLKQMGEFLEVECCSCGVCLLIGDGDKINFTSNGDEEPGFLCAVCYKEENPAEEQALVFKRHIAYWYFGWSVGGRTPGRWVKIEKPKK